MIEQMLLLVQLCTENVCLVNNQPEFRALIICDPGRRNDAVIYKYLDEKGKPVLLVIASGCLKL